MDTKHTCIDYLNFKTNIFMNILIEDNELNRIIFHFNKKHNEDNSIPMWVIKHKGMTYYVNHLDSNIGFKTKETPDNEHTKGSLQFKGKLRIVQKGIEVIAEIY